MTRVLVTPTPALRVIDLYIKDRRDNMLQRFAKMLLTEERSRHGVGACGRRAEPMLKSWAVTADHWKYDGIMCHQHK